MREMCPARDCSVRTILASRGGSDLITCSGTVKRGGLILGCCVLDRIDPCDGVVIAERVTHGGDECIEARELHDVDFELHFASVDLLLQARAIRGQIGQNLFEMFDSGHVGFL